jgi:deoxycytidylate deaminase
MLSLAMKLCLKSRHKDHYHACILTIGGAIFETGFNLEKLHAERNALMKLRPEQRKKATLYSFRFKKSGGWGMAKPCPECQKLIKESGIKKVYYTGVTGELERLSF